MYCVEKASGAIDSGLRKNVPPEERNDRIVPTIRGGTPHTHGKQADRQTDRQTPTPAQIHTHITDLEARGEGDETAGDGRDGAVHIRVLF
jgi:hypothetical protein